MAKVKVTSCEDMEVHPRGWGRELWIENSDKYCGKLLELKQGKRSSLHYHMNKTETMFLSSGHVVLRMIDPENGKEYDVTLLPGDKILLEPGQVHQICAMEDSDLFEFSTFHEDSDSWRVEKGD